MQETQPLKQGVLGFCGFGANSGQLAVLGSLHFFPAELHKISKAPFFGAGKAGQAKGQGGRWPRYGQSPCRAQRWQRRQGGEAERRQ